MKEETNILTILGSAGVAKSLLSILNAAACDVFDPILHFDFKEISQFPIHLLASQTKIVIDVSWGDTVEILDCCNKLGVHYINTALENTMIDEHEEEYEGFPLYRKDSYF